VLLDAKDMFDPSHFSAPPKERLTPEVKAAILRKNREDEKLFNGLAALRVGNRKFVRTKPGQSRQSPHNTGEAG
ncbi:MAG: hypothetical protein AAFW98_12040, partial [Pseudomonadota bacterium]